MEGFILYIAKTALALGAFYLAYLALFQEQKHFLFNRIYLPLSFLVSFIIPLITFTTVNVIRPVQAGGADSFAYLADAAGVSEGPSPVLAWYHYLMGLYVVGAVFFFCNLLLGHLKAIDIVRCSPTKLILGVPVHVTPLEVHPFSFFNRIVLSKKTLENPSLDMIVSHELVHVRERHTLDILLTELLFLLQWFNPFAWLVRDAVRSNLEYLTDDQITQKYNAEAYQMAMVGLAHKKGVAPFLTALNGSKLKTRIIMMKKKNENRYVLLKQLLVLPLLAVLTMSLSNKEVKTEILPAENTELNGAGENAPERLATDFTEAGPGTNALRADSGIVLPDSVVKGKVIMIEQGKQDTKKVPVPWVSSLQIKTTGGIQPLFIVDGEELSAEDAEKLDANLVDNISVLKDESAVAAYGEKGKNGVVLIETKKETAGKITVVGYGATKNAAAAVKTVSINAASDANPLYIVDGKPVAEIESLNPEQIESVSVLKGAEAIKLYGTEGGKNGVVLVTTKEGANAVSNVRVKVKSTGSLSGQKPLVILDGEKTDEDVNAINPENIAAISVLKSETATAKYGEEGKNGVILISTKDYAIASESELRKFIARQIMYPAKAHEANLQGVSKMLLKLKNNGELASVSSDVTHTKNAVNLDEVVVVGYKKSEINTSAAVTGNTVFNKETERVLELLPVVTAPELQGKTLLLTVKFVLQDQ